MGFYRRLLFLVFTLIVASCNNDSDSPSIDLLTVDAATIISAPDASSWFVIWDAEGKLLDSKQYTTGETLKLSTSETIADNKITIGIYSHTGTDIDNYIVSIYTDLTPGMIYKATPFENTSLVPQDRFQFTLSPDPYLNPSVFVSSKFGWTQAVYGSGTLQCQIDPKADKYVAMYRINSSPRYKAFSGASKNATITFTPADFSAYNKQFSIKAPLTYNAMDVEVRGFEADVPFSSNGYLLDKFSTSDKVSAITTGYFDDVTKLSIAVDADVTGKLMSYRKFGDPPSAITWPNVAKFDKMTGNPKAFTASATDPIQYLQASWIAILDEGTYKSTTIYSTNLVPKIGQLPAEILTAHPAFANDNGLSAYTAIWYYLGPRTYSQFITDAFNGEYNSEKEEMSVRVYSN